MTDMSFNLGDVLERVEEVLPPDTEALVCGDVRRTWGDLKHRSNSLARTMTESGLEPGDKVAFYMHNGNEYMETLAACFKGRFTHVNVNYRYLEDELWYILDNSDSRVVVYSAQFRDRIESLLPRLSGVRLFLEVGDQAPAAFAESYEKAATGNGEPLGIRRSPDDLLFIYTGGTTGHPKGVMWEHQVLLRAGTRTLGQFQVSDLKAYGEAVLENSPSPRQLPACPMMHGTGLLTALNNMSIGGCVVSVPSVRLDAELIWDTVAKEKVNSMAIVGDAFSAPLVHALDSHPGRWDLSSLMAVVSSGVMWSPQSKQGLLRHNENLLLVDTFGSSEGLGFGGSVTSRDGTHASAVFKIGDRAKVFDEDHKEVEAGSGRIGFVATSGDLPAGYYNDPEKTARTFPVIDGVRYSMPGDYCRVEADGSIVLLGRGSACINSGGEKIYPEEVEEVLKSHSGIEDALVFGIPDEKWGQAVTAVVLAPAGDFDEGTLQQYAREQLAGYKVPKRILPIEDMGRADNGKANYDYVREYALNQLGMAG